MTKVRPGSRQITPLSESEKALARLVQKRTAAATPDAPPLSETAYQRILRAIQEGTIECNTHLTEADLATWLQMSRTPVREAMRRLGSDGLLLNQPFRGAVVMTLSGEDVKELYAVRALLEVAAAGWCAQNANDAEMRAMREIIEMESRCLRDPRALIDLNRKFHREICSGAHKHFLRRTLASIQGAFALLGKSNLLSEERARASHREHHAILAAIEKRDRKGAERAAQIHVQNSLKQRLKHLPGRAQRKS
jgi:DNA-binding GntR family transcriptional regulator